MSVWMLFCQPYNLYDDSGTHYDRVPYMRVAGTRQAAVNYLLKQGQLFLQSNSLVHDGKVIDKSDPEDDIKVEVHVVSAHNQLGYVLTGLNVEVI